MLSRVGLRRAAVLSKGVMGRVVTEFEGLTDIDGEPVDMARFGGQVLLITNVASK